MISAFFIRAIRSRMAVADPNVPTKISAGSLLVCSARAEASGASGLGLGADFKVANQRQVVAQLHMAGHLEAGHADFRAVQNEIQLPAR